MYCFEKKITRHRIHGHIIKARYLVSIDEVEYAVNMLRVIQDRTRWYKSITVQLYHGKKYKPEAVRWVVEG